MIAGYIFLRFCVFVLVSCLVMLIKITIAYKYHDAIIEAIYNYRIACYRSQEIPDVDYKDMETYENTVWRMWDWGYTRILPKDKFEIIKPYIKGV